MLQKLQCNAFRGTRENKQIVLTTEIRREKQYLFYSSLFVPLFRASVMGVRGWLYLCLGASMLLDYYIIDVLMRNRFSYRSILYLLPHSLRASIQYGCVCVWYNITHFFHCPTQLSLHYRIIVVVYFHQKDSFFRNHLCWWQNDKVTHQLEISFWHDNGKTTRNETKRMECITNKNRFSNTH